MSDRNMPAVAAGRPKSFVGPDGKVLTIDDLPPPETQRWVARRKAEVVAAVRAGLLNLEEACTRYNLSTEEFMGWEAAIEKLIAVGRPQARRTGFALDQALAPVCHPLAGT